MKQFLLFPLLFIILTKVNAQVRETPGKQQSSRVYGKVVDAKTKKALDAASVQLAQNVKDSATGMPSRNILAGMFTPANGNFSFNGIPINDSITIILTAIGYRRIEQQVVLRPSTGSDATPEIDLGNFRLEQEAQVLANVIVTANRPSMELGIDRRVFKVEDNITATGGTALDVMKNIPSITVDVEGNVQLRNASPQIFVDGRPTILTLDQIPADNIDKVELITNPSAKFDASSNAGILNVILKKNKRVGLNGTASVTGGSPGILAGNVTINLREGNFNFFGSANYNESGGRADGKTFRENRRNGTIQNYFNQVSWNKRHRQFKSLRFGFDYFLDNRNTITLSHNITNGNFSNIEEQSQEYLDNRKVLNRFGTRINEGGNNFNRSSTQFIYTHKFASPGRQFTADANYNTGSGDDLTNIINTYFNQNGTSSSPAERVRNTGANQNDQLTIQVDYVHPIGETAKLEAGARMFVQNNANIFDAYSLGSVGEETKLPLSNHYKFKEVVNALYFSYSQKINKFSYQAGLRTELSKFDGELVDKAQRFGYRYPEKLKNIWDGLFPSFFLTHSLGDKEDLQFNYTRRIRRPNFRQLNPFIDFNDPVNLRQGNPSLRPEFTNSFEVNYNNNYKRGNFLAALYYRNTLGDITQYSDTLTAIQYQQLNNAAVDSNAILNTYINSQSQNRWGADITLQQTIAKNLEIVPNLSMQYRKVNAVINNNNLSNEGFSWEAKLITNYKIDAPKSWLFRNLGFQLTGEYESPEVIPQGRRKEQYSVDFALRKDLFKENKGTLTFSINDVFNTNRFGTIYDTENFYQDSYRRWNVRSFRITFSYRFGNANFSLSKRTDRNERSDNDDEGSEQ